MIMIMIMIIIIMDDLKLYGASRDQLDSLIQVERQITSKLCKSKLNGGNLICGINTWAVGVLTSMDRRIRKILAMNGCLHTRSNVARLYLPRKGGGRGLIGIEECVIPLWLPKTEHRVDASSCVKGEGDC